MKIRKHMVLIVGGGTALILIVVALFMLYRFFRTYDRVNEDLDSSMNQLRALQEREEAVERWLRTEVAATYDAHKANPGRARPERRRPGQRRPVAAPGAGKR